MTQVEGGWIFLKDGSEQREFPRLVVGRRYRATVIRDYGTPYHQLT